LIAAAISDVVMRRVLQVDGNLRADAERFARVRKTRRMRDAAKERQGFIESRIAEIETKLADARVVEIAGRVSDTIVFGATVMVIEQESQAKRQYTLVGQDEADMKYNRISIQSPVGRALIGKRVGDFIEVKTPVKTVEYEVVEIKFEEF
jgi:transcription elongation factor GreA